MNADVTWYSDDQTVVLATLEGEWNMNEYVHASQHMVDLMDEVDHTVDIIIHFVDLAIPTNVLGQLSGANRSPHMEHPHYGRVVLVGVSGLAERLLDIYKRVFKREGRIMLATTVEGAYATLKEDAGSKHNIA